MKVIQSQENLLKFDNGLTFKGIHCQDCCEYNYLDFEQFEVGDEFPDATATEVINLITLKEDGFSFKNSQGIPKWVQARSTQNGYYSKTVGLLISDGQTSVTIVGEEPYEEAFNGREELE